MIINIKWAAAINILLWQGRVIFDGVHCRANTNGAMKIVFELSCVHNQYQSAVSHPRNKMRQPRFL